MNTPVSNLLISNQSTAKIRMNLLATPLASIFGSGFLVILPVLATATGNWMGIAIIVVTSLAYAVGTAIRFNIQHAEPIIEKGQNTLVSSLDRISDVSISVAYIISITLYLQILSSFLLAGFNLTSQLFQDISTTIVIVSIVIVALTRGLGTLNFLETWSLMTTLALVVVIILGFIQYDLASIQQGVQSIPTPTTSWWEMATVVGGALIVVQGFETPRFLGNSYDAGLRVWSSRWSQIVSSTIYLAFVFLAIPLIPELGGQYADNLLIKLVTYTAIPFLSAGVVSAALLSQFSAAVADTIATQGNVTEVSQKRIHPKLIYLSIGILAIILTWSADTFEILALASKAFAFYYFLQCLIALIIAPNNLYRLGFSAIGVAMLFIVLFAKPVG